MINKKIALLLAIPLVLASLISAKMIYHRSQASKRAATVKKQAALRQKVSTSYKKIHDKIKAQSNRPPRKK